MEDAHRFAVEAEDLYEHGQLQHAAARFEKAAEAYVKATLCTNDTASLQALRHLALSHSQARGEPPRVPARRALSARARARRLPHTPFLRSARTSSSGS